MTVTAGDYTTVTLSWSPVSAPGQSVGAYIINENGAPILTVPASATTITVQGLQPGLHLHVLGAGGGKHRKRLTSRKCGQRYDDAVARRSGDHVAERRGQR